MDSLPCDRCGKHYAIRSLQADTDGKGLLCQNCFEIITKVHKNADKVQQIRMKSLEASARGKQTFRDKLIKEGAQYFCKSCKYKFVSLQQNVNRCPYCSKEGEVLEMGELVKEIDDILRNPY